MKPREKMPVEKTIAIVIAVYNPPKAMFRACLESIVAQTFRDFICILVDDGSHPETAALCDEAVVKDPRFSVIHKRNGGANYARRDGVAKALADGVHYLTFVDSDDTIALTMLEKALAGITDNDADLCYYGVDSVTGTHVQKHCSTPKRFGVVTDKLSMFKSGATIPFWDYGHHGQTCGFLCSARLFAGIDWDIANVRLSEDHIIHFQLVGNASKAVYITEALYHYHRNASSLLKSSSVYERTMNRAYFTTKLLEYASRRFPDMVPELRAFYAYDMFLIYSAAVRKWATCDKNEPPIEEYRTGIAECLAVEGVRSYISTRQAVGSWILLHFGFGTYRVIAAVKFSV